MPLNWTFYNGKNFVMYMSVFFFKKRIMLLTDIYIFFGVPNHVGVPVSIVVNFAVFSHKQLLNPVKCLNYIMCFFFFSW